MLNLIWVAFILVGFVAALAQALQGDLDIFARVLNGLFDSAKTGFEISLGLVGVMSLWLGIMKIGERGGLIQLFGRLEAIWKAATARAAKDEAETLDQWEASHRAKIEGILRGKAASGS